jgi:hypothetical protein
MLTTSPRRALIEHVGRLLKVAAMGWLVAALVFAALPVCPCMGVPSAAVASGAHDCCPSTSGERLRNAGCCDAHPDVFVLASSADPALANSVAEISIAPVLGARVTLRSHPSPLPPPLTFRSSPILRV